MVLGSPVQRPGRIDVLARVLDDSLDRRQFRQQRLEWSESVMRRSALRLGIATG